MLKASARIDGLIRQAAAHGQSAIALTDHGNMFGILEFYMVAKKLQKEANLNTKAILGCHLYVEDESIAGQPQSRDDGQMQRVVLLAENDEGYRNLVKIVSWRYETPDRWTAVPVVPISVISQYSQGLIAMTGDLFSRLGSDILQKREANARRFLDLLAEIFDETHLYLTLQDHAIPENNALNHGLRELAKQIARPLVVTQNVHYIKQEDSIGHKALLCIGEVRKLHEFDSKAYPTDQFYLKSSEEMSSLFPNDPEAIANTAEIASRCKVVIKTNVGAEFWPMFKVPPEFNDGDEFISHLAWKLLPKRYPDPSEKVKQRLQYELDVIKNMKVAGYLLIVQDFIAWARENGIPVGPGRGSAAGSLVTFVIGITNIDPLRFDLLFERFLNPERVSMPDIDTDFSDKERHLVIKYVAEKYGEECVTQIITYGAMKAKAVIRDVGRVLSLDQHEINQIAKMIPAELDINLKKAWETTEELRKLIDSRDKLKELWKLSTNLEGLVRQAGVHAAAVIIAPVPMSNLAPLYRANPSDTPVIQYDKHYAEDIGLLKMDFLGLRNLSVIQDALAMIKEVHGIDIDIDSIDLDDAKTFELLGKGLTVGVFQFESGGMQQYLRNLKPSCLEDLIAMNALYRPGPIGEIPHYIARKHGQEPVDCYHKDLNQVLGETYGVIVYQEQVMRIAQIVSGFSLGGADLLRRAMGKKDASKMAGMETDFIQKAVDRGYPREMMKKLWDVLLPFCGYAFNKSHAAAYAYVAYQTAFLKANYGPEFMAANMTSEMTSTENLVTLMLECRKMGLKILHPDVNKSLSEFTVSDNCIRYGLSGIKNVGTAVIEDLVEEREANGPFTSIFELCKRVQERQASKEAGGASKRPPLNKKTLECLTMAGALDHLHGSRAALHASVDKAMEIANRAKRDRDSGQISLFDMGTSTAAPLVQNEQIEEVEPWSYLELLNKEKEVLGLYLSGHPIDEYRAELKGFTTCSLSESEIADVPIGTIVTLGGIILSMRTLTAKADPNKVFGVAIIQDFHGEMELFLGADIFEKYRNHVSTDMMVLVKGKMDKARDDKNRQIKVEVIIPIEDARQKYARFIHLEIKTTGLVEQTLRNIQELCESFALPEDVQGGCQLIFHMETASENEHTLHATRYRVISDTNLISQLATIVGSDQVWVSNKK
jgi:DNA polymerase-3 subunit alpha